MTYRILADFVVILHLMFVLFALLGGLLLFRNRMAAWLHLPVLLWALVIEWTGRLCPLTPLENRLRSLGGEATYDKSFVEHYIVSILYPAELNRRIQIVLGLLLLGFNLAIYCFVWHQRHNLKTRR